MFNTIFLLSESCAKDSFKVHGNQVNIGDMDLWQKTSMSVYFCLEPLCLIMVDFLIWRAEVLGNRYKGLH